MQAEAQKRASFEAQIDRTFFHVQAVKQESRDVWIKYLDFETGEAAARVGKKDDADNDDAEAEPELDSRVITLFERSVISCALFVQTHSVLHRFPYSKWRNPWI